MVCDYFKAVAIDKAESLQSLNSSSSTDSDSHSESDSDSDSSIVELEIVGSESDTDSESIISTEGLENTWFHFDNDSHFSLEGVENAGYDSDSDSNSSLEGFEKVDIGLSNSDDDLWDDAAETKRNKKVENKVIMLPEKEVQESTKALMLYEGPYKDPVSTFLMSLDSQQPTTSSLGLNRPFIGRMDSLPPNSKLASTMALVLWKPPPSTMSRLLANPAVTDWEQVQQYIVQYNQIVQRLVEMKEELRLCEEVLNLKTRLLDSLGEELRHTLRDKGSLIKANETMANELWRLNHDKEILAIANETLTEELHCAIREKGNFAMENEILTEEFNNALFEKGNITMAKDNLTEELNNSILNKHTLTMENETLAEELRNTLHDKETVTTANEILTEKCQYAISQYRILAENPQVEQCTACPKVFEDSQALVAITRQNEEKLECNLKQERQNNEQLRTDLDRSQHQLAEIRESLEHALREPVLLKNTNIDLSQDNTRLRQFVTVLQSYLNNLIADLCSTGLVKLTDANGKHMLLERQAVPVDESVFKHVNTRKDEVCFLSAISAHEHKLQQMIQNVEDLTTCKDALTVDRDELKCKVKEDQGTIAAQTQQIQAEKTMASLMRRDLEEANALITSLREAINSAEYQLSQEQRNNQDLCSQLTKFERQLTLQTQVNSEDQNNEDSRSKMSKRKQSQVAQEEPRNEDSRSKFPRADSATGASGLTKVSRAESVTSATGASGSGKKRWSTWRGIGHGRRGKSGNSKTAGKSGNNQMTFNNLSAANSGSNEVAGKSGNNPSADDWGNVQSASNVQSAGNWDNQWADWQEWS